METNNTTIILNGCIKQFKEENDLSLADSEVFELFSLSQILKNEDISFENIMDSITDGGQDGGIDSIIILHNGECVESDTDYKCNSSSIIRLIITQSKAEKSFKESTLDKLITSIPELFNLEAQKTDLTKRFNPQIIEKRDIFCDLWKKVIMSGGKIEVSLNYACLANDIEITSSFSSKQQQLVAICKNWLSTDSVDFTCYSSKELLSLFQTHRRSRSKLVFKDTPLSVNYSDSGLGYIGLVKISDYKKFLTLDDGRINDELFESNIRHFQGDGVDVNKKIKQTLESNHDRDFWWLNNGITMIAEDPGQMGKNLSLENIQIVNGLQTSYSIYNLENVNDEDERSVLVKVIISSNKDVADEIIEATNFQNAVSPGLLRATDEIQKEIEMFFLQKGYYYDRRKNYYKNMGKPGNKIFGIPILAQAIKAIILKDPHSARATPTSLLKTDSSYKTIFKKDDNYQAYLNCCLAVSKTHHAILNLDDKQRKNKLVNFKFHISLIAMSIVLDKSDYNMADVSNVDMNSFNNDIILNAITKIESLISSYQQDHLDSNLINIAKSSDFTSFVRNNM